MFDLTNEIIDTFELLDSPMDEQVILQDEFDILTISKNKYGSFILSTIIEEDYNNRSLFYFLTLMTNSEYSSFINRRISYLELIQDKKAIFIAQKDYFYNIIKLFKIDLTNIPHEYLPDNQSFFPIEHSDNNYQLELVFEGKNADNHELPLYTMNKANNIIGKLDANIRDLVNLPYHELNVGLKAASFDISYFYKTVHTNIYQLFDSENLLSINNLFTKLVNLVINKVYNFNINDIFKSNEFLELQNNFYSFVLLNNKKKIPEDQFYIKFKKMIIDSMKDFVDVSELTGKGFSSLSIAIDKNDSNIGKKEKLTNIIQVIDPKVSKNIQLNEKDLNEYLDKETSSTKDSIPKKYSILIFELNTETKKGKAYLENKDSKKKPKISFSVSGSFSIIDTKITHSLAEEETIEINGLATFDQNKKITFLEIIL